MLYYTWVIERGGEGSAPGPGWAPVLTMLSVMGFSDGQFSRKLWTKKLYITPQKFKILCSGKGGSSWQVLFSFSEVLKWKKNKKESWNPIWQEWECFHFAVISLTLLGRQFFTTSFNQKSPEDSVKKTALFLKNNLSIGARKCLLI